MTAIWHDTSVPGFFAPVPQFSFHELPEIHQEAPAAYAAAMAEMRARERAFGAAWYRHNAELAMRAWARRRPWWL